MNELNNLQERFHIFCFRAGTVLIIYVLLAFSKVALSAPELLPQDKAFHITAEATQNQIVVNWEIAKGYYLYRNKFKVISKTPEVELGEMNFPKGEMKHDDYMGDTEIFRDSGKVLVPINKSAGHSQLELEIGSQGCADAGICYAPHKDYLTLAIKTVDNEETGNTSGNLTSALASLGIDNKSSKTAQNLLPKDQAFRFSAEVINPETIRVNWQLAPGYYLYRDKIHLTLTGSDGVKLGNFSVPHGEPRHDEEFGDVEVFHQELNFSIPLTRSNREASGVKLTASFQGCADIGVCYPPMQQVVDLDLPIPQTIDTGSSSVLSNPVSGECELRAPEGFVETAPQSDECEIVRGLNRDSVFWTMASFFGMGLLLAFTPCVFPMIPILSGIIVGHGHIITTRRAFLLSLSYILASSLAYTVFGILAGLFGSNLQVIMQDPRIIAGFSMLFVVLSLSMFGMFDIQMPSFIQSRLTNLSNHQEGGTLSGAALMGALSALIMGPCIAAPMAGALIFIGKTGDAILGGLALFALGLGMGLPLLAIGTSAGKLLPRAGIWMNAIKSAFGVGMLGIAISLLERILPFAFTLFLWAVLLIISAIYMGALDRLSDMAPGWRRLFKGIGIVMLCYGILMLIGAASNSSDPLQPLRDLKSGSSNPASEDLAFHEIHSIQELENQLALAKASGKWAMVDFYADWCVSCKEMERNTFTDDKVRNALGEMRLIKADVTLNTEQEQALLKKFNLFGPPATLFFGPDLNERRSQRVVGYMDAKPFLKHLERLQ